MEGSKDESDLIEIGYVENTLLEASSEDQSIISLADESAKQDDQEASIGANKAMNDASSISNNGNVPSTAAETAASVKLSNSVTNVFVESETKLIYAGLSEGNWVDGSEDLPRPTSAKRRALLSTEAPMKEATSLSEINSSEELSRPSTAKRRESVPPSPEEQMKEITNFRNLVAFDNDMESSYPEKTDSQMDFIIQQLKETANNLSTPLVNAQDPLEKTQETFPTSVPEEDLEEARRRQQRRRTELETAIYDFGIVRRKTMQEVIDEKVIDHFNRGTAQASQGQFEAAVTSFTKAITLQPNDVSCYVERAEAYLQMCDFRSAHLNYKKAFALEPHNSDLYDKIAFICYLEGQCLFDQCLYPEALECFTRAADMKPTNSGFHTRAITCLAALGRNQECLSLVTRKLESETTANPELYVLRARLHLHFRNATLCYYDVRDALSLDSEQPQAKLLMKEIREGAERSKQQALNLTIQGKLREALSKMTTAVETDPSVSEYHVLKGALHRRLKNFNEAIDDYLLAMDKADHNEIDPVYVGAQRQLLLTYNDFAVECYQKGFFEEAIILLNRAVKGEKGEMGLYVNRGDCFFKLNELGFALADYQQAIEIDPTSWETKCRIAVVHNEIGISAYQERHYQEALEQFSHAIENNGKVGQFYVHRARSYYMMQDTDSSRKDILISLHLDPDNEEIIPLVSRLFPGRAVSEVLRSKAAEAAREFIAKLAGSHGRLPPLTRKGSPQKSRASSRTVRTTPLTAGNDMLPEIRLENDGISSAESGSFIFSSMPTDDEIIEGKKMAVEELKSLFRFPKSLKYTGPRVATNIPPQPPKKKKGKNPRGYTWKKFGMGLTPA